MVSGGFTWADWARLGAMGVAVFIYCYAFYVSFTARALWSIIMWGLCILIGASYMILFGLYATGWLNVVQFREQIRPFLFPTNIVIWILPSLDWLWRLKQANEAGRVGSGPQ